MKLLTFELAGKKLAKQCSSVKQVIELNQWMIDGGAYNSTDGVNVVNIALMREALWLCRGNKWIDYNQITNITRNVKGVAQEPVDDWALRLQHENLIVDVIYDKEYKRFECVGYNFNNANPGIAIIGYFKSSTNYLKCDEGRTDRMVNLRSIIVNILNNNINLEKITNTIDVKKGKIQSTLFTKCDIDKRQLH